MDYEGKRAECELEISVVTPKQNELSRETIIINMEELVRSINEREVASSKGYKNCIPRVRKHDPSFKDPYTPKFVSIGPYFCNDSALELSNSLKKDYLVNLFKRGREDPSNEELQGVYKKCLESVKQRESEAWAYYADKINLKPEEFAAMLVLDGSFILEHLINYNTNINEKQLWSDQSAPTQLKMDLIMLENQVPFFILEELFEHVKEPEFNDEDSDKTEILMAMVLWYLASLDVEDFKMNQEETAVYHMLHLVHMYARPQPEKELHGLERFYQEISSTLIDPVCRCAAIEESYDEEAYPVNTLHKIFESHGEDYPVNTLHKIFDQIRNNLSQIRHVRVLLETVLCPLNLIFLLIFGALEQLLFYVVLTPAAHIFWRGEWPSRDSIPSATELQKVLVKVKKQNRGVFEVRLQDKTLFMSKVSIDGYAGPFLKNLVALEEELPPSGLLPHYFSHYADFMQRLIRTREDVVLLQAEGILESNLGSDDEVISFFNNLVKGHSLIADKNDQMSTVSERLKKRYRNPANIWWGMVMTNYLSNPWTIVALLVAAVQFLQTMLDLRDAEKSKKQ